MSAGNWTGVARTRRWRERHREAARLTDRMASRLRRDPALRWAVRVRDGHACLACGQTEDLVIDHILPVLQGGTNDISNLQTLCRPCNTGKRGAIDYRKPA